MFCKGIEYEREGNYYEATRCYKKALKLDASVEKKIAEEEAALCSMDTCKNILELLSICGVTLTFFIVIYYKIDESDESEDEYDNKEDLFLRFQRIMGPQICFPEHSQQVCH